LEGGKERRGIMEVNWGKRNFYLSRSYKDILSKNLKKDILFDFVSEARKIVKFLIDPS
jgi:hypothetical protein